MRVMALLDGFRHVLGAIPLAFPARRQLRDRVRELEAENAELRRFHGLAVDVATSLYSAGERAGQSISCAARSRPRS